MVFHFLIPLYHLICKLPNQLFLLSLPLASVIAGSLWRKSSPTSSSYLWNNPALVNLLAFGLVDWLLLAALPRLEFSFGPTEIPLMGMVVVRSVVIAVFLALLLLANRISGKVMASFAKSVPLLLMVANLIMLACEFDALYIEPFHLGATTLSISAPAVFHGTGAARLRIIHLSDTHVERTTRRERELIEHVAALRPDIILLTGDYVNLSYLHDEQALRDTHALLSQLHAPYGIYAVSGSVDLPSVISAVFDDLEEITFLEDEIYPLTLPQGELYLVGVSNLQRQRDQEALRHLMENVPADAYSILLYHTPDLIETAAETDVDLALVGHTHGGQIRLPFYGALFTSSIYGKKYEMGRYEVGSTILYVSRGIGMEGSHAPRARFLCPPEVIVFDLVP